MHSYGIAPPGFGLPDTAHVGAVHLQVSDLQRSLAYYTETIGLHVYDVDASNASMGPAGGSTPLLTLRTRPGVTPARRGAFGLYHFAILLPDRAALGRFAAHLAARNVRVGAADHLVSEAIYLWDPDGLGIEVYADRPRATWRHRDAELAMTTDPLDIDSVIAAAAGQPWDGAPFGTSMGHVHLHVGRIEDAEAFYHLALGFDKTVWSYPGALFMSAGGYHHHLATNVWAPGPAASPDHAQLIEWELLVEGNVLDALAASLRGGGYQPLREGNALRVADPWGTRVAVLQRAKE